MFPQFRLSLIVGLLVITTGCGGGPRPPETVPVKGVVKYQGRPVASLLVSFIPDKGMIATGNTDDQGRFTLGTNNPGDGAMVGKYKVTVRYVTNEIPPMQGLSDSPQKVQASPIPLKYAAPETTELTVTVDKDSSKNSFPLDLTD